MEASFGDRGLSELRFVSSTRARRLPPPSARPRLAPLVSQLNRYFSSGTWAFAVPLDLSAGTDFDRLVWKALLRIPPGTIRTYGEVARSVGRPGAARAVGNACGRNPVPIIVPCHRVVATNGPGGFGLGLDLKRALLSLESVHV
jgi:O-6-methylguanine DNA methyltransferase